MGSPTALTRPCRAPRPVDGSTPAGFAPSYPLRSGASSRLLTRRNADSVRRMKSVLVNQAMAEGMDEVFGPRDDIEVRVVEDRAREVRCCATSFERSPGAWPKRLAADLTGPRIRLPDRLPAARLTLKVIGAPWRGIRRQRWSRSRSRTRSGRQSTVDATRIARGNLGRVALFIVARSRTPVLRCSANRRGTCSERRRFLRSLKLICRAVSAATSRSGGVMHFRVVACTGSSALPSRRVRTTCLCVLGCGRCSTNLGRGAGARSRPDTPERPPVACALVRR